MLLRKFWKAFVPLLLHLKPKTQACEDINLFKENHINSSLDTSFQPCDDFYSYACGNYAKQHPSTEYQEITSYMDLQYNTIILNLMDEKFQHDSPVLGRVQSFVEKTTAYLKACRTERKRNLTKYFEEIKPGVQLNWPILQEVASSGVGSHQWPADAQFNVWALLGQLQSYGLNNVLINQEILINRQGEISIMLEPAISEQKTTLPDKNILHVLLLSLGMKSPVKTLNNLGKTNKKLLYILENYGEKDEESIEMTCGDLEILYPNLNLRVFLKELLGRELPADTLVLLRKPSFFQYLNDNMWSVLEKPQLCNYLMMKFLHFLAMDSTADFSSMTCVKDLRKKFDLAVNFLYFTHNYAQKAKLVQPDLYEMLLSITDMLSKYIKSNYLHLTNSQIQQLLDKLALVSLNIGNLPQDVSFKKIDDFYAHIPPLDINNYYKNHLIMLKHRFAKSLNYAPNQTHFIVPDNTLGSSSGAFYVAKQNMIILPFGSLLQPLYDVQYHDLYKYSLLGFILAHELTHAFDTYGLNFNHQGQISADYANILTNENFKNSLKCLQSQLATDSIDERIADTVAIQIVYKIFVTKYNNLQPTFLNSIWNKNFYLNVAQFFCGKKNLKFIDHDSDAQRLNQIVVNSRGFALAFNCPENSKMNPREKCRLY